MDTIKIGIALINSSDSEKFDRKTIEWKLIKKIYATFQKNFPWNIQIFYVITE